MGLPCILSLELPLTMASSHGSYIIQWALTALLKITFSQNIVIHGLSGYIPMANTIQLFIGNKQCSTLK